MPAMTESPAASSNQPDRGRRPNESPLDPFVDRLLTMMLTEPAGMMLATAARQLAQALDWDPQFVEAVIQIARARGYLQQFPQPGNRGAGRIGVSARGRAWLDSS